MVVVAPRRPAARVGTTWAIAAGLLVAALLVPGLSGCRTAPPEVSDPPVLWGDQAARCVRTGSGWRLELGWLRQAEGADTPVASPPITWTSTLEAATLHVPDPSPPGAASPAGPNAFTVGTRELQLPFVDAERTPAGWRLTCGSPGESGSHRITLDIRGARDLMPGSDPGTDAGPLPDIPEAGAEDQGAPTLAPAEGAAGQRIGTGVGRSFWSVTLRDQVGLPSPTSGISLRWRVVTPARSGGMPQRLTAGPQSGKTVLWDTQQPSPYAWLTGPNGGLALCRYQDGRRPTRRLPGCMAVDPARGALQLALHSRGAPRTLQGEDVLLTCWARALAGDPVGEATPDSETAEERALNQLDAFWWREVGPPSLQSDPTRALLMAYGSGAAEESGAPSTQGDQLLHFHLDQQDLRSAWGALHGAIQRLGPDAVETQRIRARASQLVKRLLDHRPRRVVFSGRIRIQGSGKDEITVPLPAGDGPGAIPEHYRVADTAWSGYWLLQLEELLPEQSGRIRDACRSLVRFLLANRLGKGGIPGYLEGRFLAPRRDIAFGEGREGAVTALFLMEWASRHGGVASRDDGKAQDGGQDPILQLAEQLLSVAARDPDLDGTTVRLMEQMHLGASGPVDHGVGAALWIQAESKALELLQRTPTPRAATDSGGVDGGPVGSANRGTANRDTANGQAGSTARAGRDDRIAAARRRIRRALGELARLQRGMAPGPLANPGIPGAVLPHAPTGGRRSLGGPGPRPAEEPTLEMNRRPAATGLAAEAFAQGYIALAADPDHQASVIMLRRAEAAVHALCKGFGRGDSIRGMARSPLVGETLATLQRLRTRYGAGITDTGPVAAVAWPPHRAGLTDSGQGDLELWCLSGGETEQADAGASAPQGSEGPPASFTVLDSPVAGREDAYRDGPERALPRLERTGTVPVAMPAIDFRPARKVGGSGGWRPVVQLFGPIPKDLRLTVDLATPNGPLASLPMAPWQPSEPLPQVAGLWRAEEALPRGVVAEDEPLRAHATAYANGHFHRAPVLHGYRLRGTAAHRSDCGDAIEWDLLDDGGSGVVPFGNGLEQARRIPPGGSATWWLEIPETATEVDLTLHYAGPLTVTSGEAVLFRGAADDLGDAPTGEAPSSAGPQARTVAIPLADRRLWRDGGLMIRVQAGTQRSTVVAFIDVVTRGAGADLPENGAAPETQRPADADPEPVATTAQLTGVRILAIPVAFEDLAITTPAEDFEQALFGAPDYRLTPEPESRPTSGSLSRLLARWSGGIANVGGAVGKPIVVQASAEQLRSGLGQTQLRQQLQTQLKQALQATADPLGLPDLVILFHGAMPAPPFPTPWPGGPGHPPILWLPERERDGSIISSGTLTARVLRALIGLQRTDGPQHGAFGDLALTAKDGRHLPPAPIGLNLARLGWADRIRLLESPEQRVSLPRLREDRAFLQLATPGLPDRGELILEQGSTDGGAAIYWELIGRAPLWMAEDGRTARPELMRLTPDPTGAGTPFLAGTATDLFAGPLRLDGASRPDLATPQGEVPWRIPDLGPDPDGRTRADMACDIFPLLGQESRQGVLVGGVLEPFTGDGSRLGVRLQRSPEQWTCRTDGNDVWIDVQLPGTGRLSVGPGGRSASRPGGDGSGLRVFGTVQVEQAGPAAELVLEAAGKPLLRLPLASGTTGTAGVAGAEEIAFEADPPEDCRALRFRLVTGGRPAALTWLDLRSVPRNPARFRLPAEGLTPADQPWMDRRFHSRVSLLSANARGIAERRYLMVVPPGPRRIRLLAGWPLGKNQGGRWTLTAELVHPKGTWRHTLVDRLLLAPKANRDAEPLFCGLFNLPAETPEVVWLRLRLDGATDAALWIQALEVVGR